MNTVIVTESERDGLTQLASLTIMANGLVLRRGESERNSHGTNRAPESELGQGDDTLG